MKSIALLPRRADFSRAQFKEYYETRHAPLALGYFPFAKYVRNHLLEDDGIGFDTISEFWNEDIARMASLMQTEIGEIFRADERRFMERERITMGGSTETLLAGSPRPVEAAPCLKQAWLLQRTPDADAAVFAVDAANWGRDVAVRSRCTRATLDVISPWPGPAFPFQAILWLWEQGGAAAVEPPTPRALSRWHGLAVLAHESPPEVMAAALRARASSPI
jgi:hypothetical protein